MADVFRWTGHFPERTRSLMRHLAKRADALGLSYAKEAETEAIVSVTIFVASLAMNYVHRGSYFPETSPPVSSGAALAEKAAVEEKADPPSPAEGNGKEPAASEQPTHKSASA